MKMLVSLQLITSKSSPTATVVAAKAQDALYNKLFAGGSRNRCQDLAISCFIKHTMKTRHKAGMSISAAPCSHLGHVEQNLAESFTVLVHFWGSYLNKKSPEGYAHRWHLSMTMASSCSGEAGHHAR